MQEILEKYDYDFDEIFRSHYDISRIAQADGSFHFNYELYDFIIDQYPEEFKNWLKDNMGDAPEYAYNIGLKKFPDIFAPLVFEHADDVLEQSEYQWSLLVKAFESFENRELAAEYALKNAEKYLGITSQAYGITNMHLPKDIPSKVKDEVTDDLDDFSENYWQMEETKGVPYTVHRYGKNWAGSGWVYAVDHYGDEITTTEYRPWARDIIVQAAQDNPRAALQYLPDYIGERYDMKKFDNGGGPALERGYAVLYPSEEQPWVEGEVVKPLAENHTRLTWEHVDIFLHKNYAQRYLEDMARLDPIGAVDNYERYEDADYAGNIAYKALQNIYKNGDYAYILRHTEFIRNLPYKKMRSNSAMDLGWNIKKSAQQISDFDRAQLLEDEDFMESDSRNILEESYASSGFFEMPLDSHVAP